MRILMTTDPVGGVWTYSMELARNLGRYGVEVVLASMGGPLSARQRAEANSLGNLELHVSTLKLEWMDDPWQDVARAGDWLLDLADRADPDLVHMNGYAHASLPFGRPVLVVAHSCVLSWWQAVKNEPAPDRYDAYRDAVRSAVRVADIVAAPSRAMLRALDRHYGPLSINSTFIYNGRDSTAFAPGPKRPVVFAAGRLWDQAKNLAGLAEASAGLDWPVRIAGDPVGPDGQTVPADGAKLLGRLSPEQVADEMAAASIYALPARYEPFGLSVLEAALAGCALLLGDIESLREIWFGCAEFVPPNDAQAVHDALARMISDDRHRELLAGRARRRALELTPQRMTAGYMELYRSLLAGARRARRSRTAGVEAVRASQ